MVDPTSAAVAAASPVRRTLAADPGVRFAFTGAAEGNLSLLVGDADPGARDRAAALVDLEAVDLVFMEQVHGPGVAVVGLSDAGRGLDDHARAVPEVDALVTTDPDVGLVVLVADCVPVLLAVPRRGVAAVHAGRAGVASGIIGAGVHVLTEQTGARPGDVHAVLGPAIGGCCYEVPAELQLEVALRAPAARARTSWGTPSLDLPAAVVEQLRAAGVMDVDRVAGCTRCGSGTWFSHRAATDAESAPGRQAGVVRLGARSHVTSNAAPPGSPVVPCLDSG
jgi:polyphenol oxidase